MKIIMKNACKHISSVLHTGLGIHFISAIEMDGSLYNPFT